MSNGRYESRHRASAISRSDAYHAVADRLEELLAAHGVGIGESFTIQGLTYWREGFDPTPAARTRGQTGGYWGIDGMKEIIALIESVGLDHAEEVGV